MNQETVTVARDVWFRVVVSMLKAERRNEELEASTLEDAELLSEANAIITAQQEVITSQRTLLDGAPQAIADMRKVGQEDVLRIIRQSGYHKPFYSTLHGIAAAEALRRWLDYDEAAHKAAHENSTCPLGDKQ